MRRPALASLLLSALLAPFPLAAQDASPPAPAPTPAPTPAPAAAEPSPLAALKEPVAFRPIEANVVINVPSVEVPSAGTLTLLVTHRFVGSLQKGDINNFFTLDTGNTWGFGLWYAPVKNLNVGVYRSSDNNTYEASAEYQLPSFCGFMSSLRVGEDWRTWEGYSATPKSSFFAQAILAYSFGQYVRLTAVPTYLQRTNGINAFFPTPIPGDQSCVFIEGNTNNPYRCSGLYENIFNVPVAASIAITHSITVHGEVIPALSKVNSRGVGWSVSVEKSLLRHRFAFYAGNQRQTTVDRYVQAVPDFGHPKDVFIGFNLFRAWNLK
jgi:hypothetical protein